MKLIAIYNVWGDSLELLRGSIQQIRDCVDFVLIIAQEESNAGEVDRNVYPFCNNLIDEKLANQVIIYNPLKKSLLDDETRKRQMGINFALDNGFSHFIHMDSDEYYFPHEFQAAKELIVRDRIKSSCIDLYTYYKEPNYRLANKETYLVPFIHEVNKFSRTGKDFRHNYPMPVDPSRAISGSSSKRIPGISMHHFSYVRRDIEKKLRNSTARKNINRKDVIEEFHSAKIGTHLRALYNDVIVESENHFNINIDEREKA
jgi:hypothetical protein